MQVPTPHRTRSSGAFSNIGKKVITRDGGDSTTFFPSLKDLTLTFGSIGGTETGTLQTQRQRQIQQQKTSSPLQEVAMVSTTLKSSLLHRERALLIPGFVILSSELLVALRRVSQPRGWGAQLPVGPLLPASRATCPTPSHHKHVLLLSTMPCFWEKIFQNTFSDEINAYLGTRTELCFFKKSLLAKSYLKSGEC